MSVTRRDWLLHKEEDLAGLDGVCQLPPIPTRSHASMRQAQVYANLADADYHQLVSALHQRRIAAES